MRSVELTEKPEREKWVRLIKTMDFFKPFLNEELDKILDFSELKKYKPFSFIIKEEDDPGEDYWFYVVLHGQVSIIKETMIKSKRKVASMFQGDCFGEIAMLLSEPRTASAMAVVETILFKVRGSRIENLPLETREKLFKEFAIRLARQLKQANTELAT